MYFQYPPQRNLIPQSRHSLHFSCSPQRHPRHPTPAAEDLLCISVDFPVLGVSRKSYVIWPFVTWFLSLFTVFSRFTYVVGCVHGFLPFYSQIVLFPGSVQSLSCVWLFADPMDCSTPGSSVQGILQARILEWVAMPSSRGIVPTQGSNPRLLHWQAVSLPPNRLGRSPGVLAVSGPHILWVKLQRKVHCSLRLWWDAEDSWLSTVNLPHPPATHIPQVEVVTRPSGFPAPSPPK